MPFQACPEVLRRARALAAAGLLLALPAAAEEEAAAERFAEEISVIVVEIPVRVLDRGRPVAGLGADDFEIWEGDKRQEITGFEVVDLSPGEVAAAPAPAAEPAAPAAQQRRRHFLLLFDLVFSRRHLLLRSLRGAEEMVDSQLHARDRVAVGVFSGAAGARLLTGFTEDRRQTALALEVVRAILDADRRREVRARAELASRLPDASTPEGRRAARRRLTSELGPAAALVVGSSAGSVGLLDGFALGPRDRLAGPPSGRAGRDEPAAVPFGGEGSLPTGPEGLGAVLAEGSGLSAVRALALSLGELATLLREVPGPKHLLLFSEGFGTALVGDAFVLHHLNRMVRAFRTSGWTIEAIDVEGVPEPGAPGFDAEALFVLANETGGELFENYGDIGTATGRVVERTSVTYVLAYQRRDLRADGRYRRVEVKLRGGPPGARVVHRPGYYAPAPFARLSRLERRLDAAGLLLGGEERRELAGALFAAPLPGAAAPARVPVVVELAGDSLLAGTGKRQDRLWIEIQAYALGRSGGVEDLFLQSLGLDLEKVGDTLRRGGLRFLGELDLPPGEYTLRVLARDLGGGRSFLTTEELSVAAPGAGAPALMPPLFLDSSGAWLLTRQPDAARREHPFTLAGREFVPAAEPAVRRGQALAFCLLAAGLPADASRVGGRVLTAGGEAVAGGGEVQLLERAASGAADATADGLARIVGLFEPRGLAAGAYRLEITVTDRTTGAGATAAAPFRIVEDPGGV